MGSLKPVYYFRILLLKIIYGLFGAHILLRKYIRAQNWNQLAQSNIRSLKMYHWDGWESERLRSNVFSSFIIWRTFLKIGHFLMLVDWVEQQIKRSQIFKKVPPNKCSHVTRIMNLRIKTTTLTIYVSRYSNLKIFTRM